jgi:hypothetical protein
MLLHILLNFRLYSTQKALCQSTQLREMVFSNTVVSLHGVVVQLGMHVTAFRGVTCKICRMYLESNYYYTCYVKFLKIKMNTTFYSNVFYGRKVWRCV